MYRQLQTHWTLWHNSGDAAHLEAFMFFRQTFYLWQVQKIALQKSDRIGRDIKRVTSKYLTADSNMKFWKKMLWHTWQQNRRLGWTMCLTNLPSDCRVVKTNKTQYSISRLIRLMSLVVLRFGTKIAGVFHINIDIYCLKVQNLCTRQRFYGLPCSRGLVVSSQIGATWIVRSNQGRELGGRVLTNKYKTIFTVSLFNNNLNSSLSLACSDLDEYPDNSHSLNPRSWSQIDS
jgi:hypothetical protein